MNFLFKRTLNISPYFLHKTSFKYFSQISAPKKPHNGNNGNNGNNVKVNVKPQNAQLPKETARWTLDLEGFNKTEFDCKMFQNEINRVPTLTSLFQFYESNKEKMDLVNICTCLDKAVDFTVKNFQITGSSHPLSKREEVKDMIEYLSQNINKMNEFAVSNFLSNLVKLGIFNRALINKLIQRILENQAFYTEKSLSYIIWALARANIRNDKFLSLITKRILEKVIKSNFRYILKFY